MFILLLVLKAPTGNSSSPEFHQPCKAVFVLFVVLKELRGEQEEPGTVTEGGKIRFHLGAVYLSVSEGIKPNLLSLQPFCSNSPVCSKVSHLVVSEKVSMLLIAKKSRRHCTMCPLF